MDIFFLTNRTGGYKWKLQEEITATQKIRLDDSFENNFIQNRTMLRRRNRS